MPANHNVRLTFALRISDGVASGIWSSSVLSTYLQLQQGGGDHANEVMGGEDLHGGPGCCCCCRQQASAWGVRGVRRLGICMRAGRFAL